MVLCFNCSPEVKALLDRLLESGQYRDYGEAIQLAIRNLVTLQGEVEQQGTVILGSTAQDRPARSGVQRPQPETRERQSKSRPQLWGLALADLAKPPASFPPPLDDVWVAGQEVPLDRWILGQYNRLLPAKVSCRVLAHLSPPPLVAIESTAAAVAEQAKRFAEQLRTFDARQRLDRDEAFSTAFPTGDADHKSLLRYANQFVGSMSKTVRLSGLLVDLKLITLTKDREPLLALTEIGWEFAAIPNPVIDEFPPADTRRFSTEEVALLTRHIIKAVPVEDFAYRAILAAISTGASTPESLDAALQRFISSEKREHLSQAFLASQRSGVISRMADLGLVRRERDGVRVTYCLQEEGRAYLNAKETAVA